LNRKVALIYIDSGGGHRAAATSLLETIRRQQRPWDVQMLGMQNLLDSIDFIHRYTGIPFQEVYNIMLRRGWTRGSAQLIPVMHLLIRLSHRRQVRVLEAHWTGNRPDLVVSVVPHYNRALKESLERAWPGTPFVTILTDLADYPPHFWIERLDQYVICGSERAAAQAGDLGIPRQRILRTSGMILHPRFYEPLNLDRGAERMRLGLRPDLPTGIVFFGGEGSMQMVEIARRLNRDDAKIQLILLCGKHEKAASELRALPRRIPMVVEGFTREIPFYLELGDFLIGKPGPGSISEALAKGLPVIVQRDARTLAHERYNADWVEEQGFGMAVASFSNILQDVRWLLLPGNFGPFRQKIAAIRNRAVFEIPDLLEGILSENVDASRPAAVPALAG
jgi:hypothetical protein